MQQPPDRNDQSTPIEPGYLAQPGYPLEHTGGEQAAPTAQPEHGAPPEGETGVLLSRLKGLPIVDVSTGTRIGEVEDVLLSLDHRYVEAFTVRGGFLRKEKAIPATGATIGEDAIAVRLPPGAEGELDATRAGSLPRAHRLLSLRLLTDAGRIAGKVVDVRLDPRSGLVLAYEVRPVDEGLADRLRRTPPHVLPATAVQQHGEDALIISDALARQYLVDEA